LKKRRPSQKNGTLQFDKGNTVKRFPAKARVSRAAGTIGKECLTGCAPNAIRKQPNS